MSRPILFISHSTGDCDDSHRVVQMMNALCDRLRGNWDVFVDRDRIKGGDRWRPTILDHIQRAQAAIVLFDNRASDRVWVAAETLMFCFRRSLSASFQFVPVLFDGLKLSDTAFEKYEPFGLNEVQAVSDRGQSIDVLADEVSGLFRRPEVSLTPSIRWVEQLVTILESVTTDGWTYAADAMDIDCNALVCSAAETRRYLARSTGQLMHHHRWREMLATVERLLDHLALQPTPPQQATRQQRKLCTLVRTKWVPNESVEMLLCAARRRPDLGVLAINADEAHLIRQYQARIQSEFDGSLRLVSVTAAAGDNDPSRLEAVRSALLATLLPNGRLPRTASGFKPLEDAVASMLSDQRLFLLLTLPYQFATVTVVRTLRRDFPGIVILIAVPIDIGELPFPVRWLTPRVTYEAANEFDELDNRLTSASV